MSDLINKKVSEFSMFLNINEHTCKQDGLCALACPMGLIVQEKGKFPTAIPNAEKFCVGCGHCMAVCPYASLSIGNIPANELVPIQKELVVSQNSMEHLIKKHRSIREYQSKPVPHETIANILDTLRWAPTAGNKQPVHWLVIEKAEEVKKLSKLLAEGTRALNFNPAFVEAWDKGKDVFLRGAPHVLIAHAASANNFMPTTDCSIAISFFDLLAATYGIGTCWAGLLMIVAGKYKPVMEALKLPEGHQVYGAIMFGYPKFQYHRIPKRNPAKITWQ